MIEPEEPAEPEEPVQTNGFDEYFENNGFTIARKGRHIIMQSHRNDEQQRAFLQSVRDQRLEIEALIPSQVEEVLNILRKYDPFDILANVSLRNSIINPEEFKEYELDINPAYTEYVALLCLTLPYESFEVEQHRSIPPGLIDDIQDKVQSLYQNQALFLAFKNVNPERLDTLGADERFRFLTLMELLLVRYPDYHHHLVEDLHGIFSPLSNEMDNTLGFNIDDAILILNTIGDLISIKLNEKRGEAIRGARELRKAVKNYRRRKKIKQILSKYPRDLLENLAKEKPSVSAKRIQYSAIAFTFDQIGLAFSFTVKELGEETGLDPERVSAFLQKFSIRFGEVDLFFRIPAPTYPLMRKPFINRGDRYICPVINSAYWAIRPAIEGFWNPQSKTKITSGDSIWQIYLKSRANYLESTSIACLARGLKFSTAYQNLKYDVVNDKGEKIETELDGLITLDNALFLIEAKSGSLSLPARRGAPSVKEDLTKLVEEAYLQALRASNYITNSETPVFRLHDGSELVLEKNKYNDIFLITVSLDDLDTFVTNTYLLKEFGLLRSDNQYPWAVALANLRVISEISEFSSQFVHYIKRRLHINELGWVNAHDELDWFGHYLLEGLYFDHLKKNHDEKFVYNLLSYSWIFDDYYFYITGQRKTPVDKPSQTMPAIMRQVLTELDNKHDNGYLRVACCLLDMSSESREELFNAVQILQKKTLKDREIHSITMPFIDGDFGFAYFICPSEFRHTFPDHFIRYSILKKYQTKLYRWVTIGCISDTPSWVDYFVVVEGQWAFNEDLDADSKRLLEPWPGNGQEDIV